MHLFPEGQDCVCSTTCPGAFPFPLAYLLVVQLGEKQAHMASEALTEFVQVGPVLICLTPAQSHLEHLVAAHHKPEIAGS
jgi:hypothetical protein